MQDQPNEGAYRIPVYAKGEIAGWALVDSVDNLWASQYRWHLSEGYAARGQRKGGPKNKPVRIFMHREILGLKHGYPGMVGDHLNGVRLDNRRTNLRVVTMRENGQNKPSYKGSSSKYRGVHWYTSMGVWRVAIMVDGHRTVVGYFHNEHEAGEAAAAFYREHMPNARTQ
jgi:hypothetical protein